MTDRVAVWKAPAKVNLFLHVVGRRPDGYHLIQSAMQLIDLCDDVTIVVRDDGRIERSTALAGVPEDADLTIRAAQALRSASATPLGASIGVEKRIPMGGGLGGGSSDAATVLLALNRLWGLDWPRERLMALGLALGADVPFFIGGGDAFVEGIGEKLTPIALPAAHYAIVHPGVAVPTAAIFSAAELTRDSPTLRISDFSKNVSGMPGVAQSRPSTSREMGTRGTRGTRRARGARGRGSDFRNDLESVAAARFDAVRDALSWLSRSSGSSGSSGSSLRTTDDEDWPGALGVARMSGSGACVFRSFASGDAAEACVAQVPPGWTGWSVRSLARHPHRDGAAG